MLNKAKFIEETLLLTAEDVEGFNPFIPVYIDKYGCYFYVNKIKNFMDGQPAKIELIRL
ncbi:MAG: hypothetical protein LBK47_07390 [Prevotellaceae bacterium]|jgi:hypothetical protein|nr:hypothetical protein [Prevotellaceae bacterium]